jgi:hypothetical protein
MSKRSMDAMKDLILTSITRRNVGSGNWTRPIPDAELQSLLPKVRFAMIKKLSIQLGVRY